MIIRVHALLLDTHTHAMRASRMPVRTVLVIIILQYSTSRYRRCIKSIHHTPPRYGTYVRRCAPRDRAHPLPYRFTADWYHTFISYVATYVQSVPRKNQNPKNEFHEGNQKRITCRSSKRTSVDPSRASVDEPHQQHSQASQERLQQQKL